MGAKIVLTQIKVGCILLFFVSTSCAMITFDPQNHFQSVKNYIQQLKHLNELKQQTEHHVAQLRNGVQQIEMQKANLKKLDFNAIRQLEGNLNNMGSILGQTAGITGNLSQIDRQYGRLYLDAGAKPLPGAQQNQLLQAQLRQNIDSNRNAMNSLKVLESYEADWGGAKKVIDSSQNAAGVLQAIQSSNQLLGILVKNMQEMKLLMGRDLEQRSVAVAEDNTEKVIVHQRKQEFVGKRSKGPGQKIKLPRLK